MNSKIILAAKSLVKPPVKPKAPRKPLHRIKQKSVGAIILNADNKVLIMFSSANKYWEFPKGKVEKGEGELDTLKREMMEETGIKRFRLHPSFREYLYYTFRVNNLLIQKVVVYYLFKTGSAVRLSDEHTDYKWVDIADAATFLKHSNQKDLLKRVQDFLAKHPL